MAHSLDLDGNIVGESVGMEAEVWFTILDLLRETDTLSGISEADQYSYYQTQAHRVADAAKKAYWDLAEFRERLIAAENVVNICCAQLDDESNRGSYLAGEAYRKRFPLKPL